MLPGVTVRLPMRRSGRKSDRTTACTESLCVVSTSKTSSVTGVVPRRPVESSGSLRKTESTVVMESSDPVRSGWNDVASTSKRSTPTVTSVSGRLATSSVDDNPSVG